MLKQTLSRYFSVAADYFNRSREKIAIKDAMKASESPTGFLVIAGVGLLLVLAINVAGTSPGVHSALDIEPTESTLEDADGNIDTQAPNKEAKMRNNASSTQLPAEPKTETIKLGRGETLIGLLKRAGIANRNAHAAINQLNKVTNLRKLQRGQEIRLTRKAGDGQEIHSLRLRDNFGEEAVVEQSGTRYAATRKAIETVELTHLIEGTITDNLYLSARRAGMPDSVIIELIRMMSFNVDFEREIREGDQFEVYFERRYAPTFNDTKNGRILHVNLALKKQPVNATWYEDDTGNGGYFDDKGASTRRALMKTPLDIAVVTSTYGRRKHPVLGYTRMHKGVDFRARTGTPIMAAGDGVIEMSARNGSYGNYIRIRHNDTYKTAYGHLSRYGKGIKRGKRVTQGQIIGYAGATGRVTAAHLHYEVLVSGQQSNPMTLKLPTGRVLKDTDLKKFSQRRTNIVADMARIRVRDQLVAASQVAATAGQ